MDDVLELSRTEHERHMLEGLEELVAQQAALVIASSETLKNRLEVRYGVRDVEVVRNGLSEGFIEQTEAAQEPHHPHRIRYFGTVGRWIDFVSLISLANALPEARIELVGPVSTQVPNHPRITALGAVPHEAVPRMMKQAALLLLPFRLEPLVEGVDPVKLYEYIATGRPVLARYYAELAHFGSLVGFYTSHAELIQNARAALGGDAVSPTDPAQRAGFIARSTWSVRSHQIESALRDRHLLP